MVMKFLMPVLPNCLCVLFLAAAVGRVFADDFQGSTHLMPFDEDTIRYAKSPATGAIARLQHRIDRGEVKLELEEGQGYL